MIIQAISYGEVNTARLPKEYQEVEWIQSSGTQYIDTRFAPSVNTKIIGDAEWISITNYPMLCGVYESNSNRFAMFYQAAWTAWIADKVVNISGDYSGRKTITLDKNTFVVSGTSAATNASDFTGTESMYVFAMHHPNGVRYYANLRLYSLQIYESNTISRDFVPCYRKADGVVGLYDIVNDTFYTNAGTGTFIKGADVGGGGWSGETLAFPYSGDFTDNRDENGIGDVTLNTSGTLTVTSGTATVSAYILGGGGGAAHSRYSVLNGGMSGGGGGNQTVEVELVPGTYEIIIGTGGSKKSGSHGSTVTAGTGGDTTAFGVTSTGGTGGSINRTITSFTGGIGGTPNGGNGAGGFNNTASLVTYAGGTPNGGNVQSAVPYAGGDGLVRITFS